MGRLTALTLLLGAMALLALFGTVMIWIDLHGAAGIVLVHGAQGPDDADGVLQPGQRLISDLGFARVLVGEPEAFGDGPHPTLVFLHGVTVLGLDDARLLHAVRGFQEAGFLLVVPEVPLLVHPPHDDQDEARLQTLLGSLGRIPGVDRERVGLVGVSVGGGMALRAALQWARSSSEPRLRGVLALGTPADIRRTARHWFQLSRPEGGERTFEERQREEARFARNVIARASLEALVPDAGDRERLRTWLESTLDPEEDPEGLTSSEGRAHAVGVRGTPATWASLAPRWIEAAWPHIRPFSPVDPDLALEELREVPVHLLHGVHDPLVPVAEAEALAGRLRAVGVTVHVLESHMLGHVDAAAQDLATFRHHASWLQGFLGGIARP